MSELLLFNGYISNAGEMDDGEFVKQQYEKYGTDFLEHIQGNFSFGLYDRENDRLILARDRFGAKSLYYYLTKDGNLLFTGTLHEMLKLGEQGFKKAFNHTALELYLTYSYVPGEDTLFEGVKKLMPGRMLILSDYSKLPSGSHDALNFEIKRYFKITPEPDDSLTMEECANEIHEALLAAAPDWMRHIEQIPEVDAPYTGNFLSGGVDSGYLTALMGSKTTFSAGYDDPEFDESPLARQTAEALGIDNTKVLVNPDEYFSLIPDVMDAMEQPIADASCIVFYICCREASRHVKVCFSGEGADELFSGYHAYTRRFRQLEEAKRNGVDLATLPKVEDFFIGNTKLFHEDEKKKILKEYQGQIMPLELARSLYDHDEDKDDMQKIMLCDLALWFEGDIMLNAEKMSEAFDLDARTPFLDHRVVKAAMRIPSKYRVNEEQTKLAFRKASEHLLPVDIAQRKKIGFPAPTRTWMSQEPYLSMIRDKVTGDTASIFFNTDELLYMFSDEETVKEKWRYIWCIYVFVIWYERVYLSV